jgi:hypothetical protein
VGTESLVRIALSLVVAALLVGPASAAAAPPPNDAFESPQALTTGVPATGTTEEAGVQEGEPEHAWWNGHSVWFAWTAPASGVARVSACGSRFDTVVAVYAGTTLSGLWPTRVANNDDGCYHDGLVDPGDESSTSASVVFARVEAGHTYRIALDGSYYLDKGEYRLVADMVAGAGPAPANDEVEDAALVTGETPTATADITGATTGWNELPFHATRVVWWRWVAPVGGKVTVDTCASDFDSVVDVVTEHPDGYLYSVSDSYRHCGDAARGRFDAFAGQEYWIAVGGRAGAAGTVSLSLSTVADATAPVTTITEAPDAVSGRRLAEFTYEVSDAAPTHTDCSWEGGGWYRCSNHESFGGLEEGEHVFRVRSTDIYGNVEEPVEYRWTVSIPEAPNDDFADAIELVSGVPVSVNNGKATAEPGELAHNGYSRDLGAPASNSVWFRFTAHEDGVAKLEWCDHHLDLTAGVYTGASLDELTPIGFVADGCEGSLFVTGGETYSLALDAQFNPTYGTGPITLTVQFPHATPDPGGGEEEDGGEEQGGGEEEDGGAEQQPTSTTTSGDDAAGGDQPRVEERAREPEQTPTPTPPQPHPPAIALPPAASQVRLPSAGTLGRTTATLTAVLPSSGRLAVSARTAAGALVASSAAAAARSGRLTLRMPLRRRWAERLRGRRSIVVRVTVRLTGPGGGAPLVATRFVTLSR